MYGEQLGGYCGLTCQKKGLGTNVPNTRMVWKEANGGMPMGRQRKSKVMQINYNVCIQHVIRPAIPSRRT